MSKKRVVTIGNYDGVHLGHRALLERSRQHAGEGSVAVLSFDPHPASILRPEDVPDRLTTFDQRRVLLEGAGADRVDRLVPEAELLAMTPEAFIEQLVETYQPELIVEGPDFRFGHRRAGTIEVLIDLGRHHGFEVDVVEPVNAALDNQSMVTVRSSLIRWLLARGRVADAATLLDRPYAISGVVKSGEKQGRQLGVPTANCQGFETMLPCDGVYGGLASDPNGDLHVAAISVGTKPTFGSGDRHLEVHLIGYEGPVDHYDWPIDIQFVSWVREQLAFESLQSLTDQMGRDIAQVSRHMAVRS